MKLIDAISLKKRITDKLLRTDADNGLNVLRKEFVSATLEIIDQSEVFTIEKIILPKFNTEKNEWYDVRDKLPAKHSNVLCYFIYDDGSGAMSENHYHGNGRWLADGKHVVFWRELPELPEALFGEFDEDEYEGGEEIDDDEIDYGNEEKV